MKVWKICALFAVACAVIAGVVCYAGSRLTKEAPEPPSPEPGLTYDSTSVMRSYESWMFFSENFHAAYEDSAFTGKYQLVYPIRYPLDKLNDSKFDSLAADLSSKLDRAIGKMNTAVFPSYSMVVTTASPMISAESGSSQNQPRFGMPIGFYPG